MSARPILRLVLCLALCLGVGAVGAVATYPEIPTWYAGLAKPSWTPPNWAFPVVWNTLYVAMGVSLWMLWERTPPSPERSTAIGLFVLQLALNAAWSPVFFKLHQTRLALAIIVAMIVAVAATIGKAWNVHRAAAWLLVPYLAWITYASTLNAGIVALNP